nr:ribonuclease H-like domain, reverse transcriptase, RNA-dependent DNA polymerase [Tanacetum cinerariifolium]
MKEDDTMDAFTAKLNGYATMAKELGKTLNESLLIRKLLDSTPDRFIQIVASTEQTNDLDDITSDEIVGKLKAFEERIKLRKEGQVESPENLQFKHGEHSGKGRRFSKCGGQIQPGKYATADESIWYLDNGASNHMTGTKSHFRDIDESVRGRAFSTFKEFRKQIEMEMRMKLRMLRTDRGVETRNRTLLSTTRSKIKAMKLPLTFWVEAIKHAIYILNRVPIRALVDKTPYEALYNRKPNLENLRIFECITYAKITIPHLKQLDDRSIPMIYLGVEEGSKACRLYDPKGKRKHVSRDEHEPIIDLDSPITLPTYTYNPNSEEEEEATISSLMNSKNQFDDTPIRGLKWGFKTKKDAKGKIIKYKPRLVAKGYVQEHGIDFDEVFAPVARIETVRLILALAAYHGWQVHHLDVKSALLHRDLKEEVYVTQPEGLIQQGNSKNVYKLTKALYGLRQASRAWNVKLDQTLKSLDFEKCNLEQAVYTKRSKTSTLIVGVYVDDLKITGTLRKEIDLFKSQMEDKFEMSDLGLLAYYLGIEVTQTGGVITITRTYYINKILKETSMMENNDTKIPMDPGTKLVKAEDGNSVDIYARPKGSPPEGNKASNLIHQRNKGAWHNIQERRRLQDYRESPITWCTQKQPTVALSTCESEFIAATGAACQALWLKRLLSELTGWEEKRITLKVDNISAIALVRNLVFHGKSKHIDIRYHFIRECIQNGHINVEHVSGELQRADILTKALPRLNYIQVRVTSNNIRQSANSFLCYFDKLVIDCYAFRGSALLDYFRTFPCRASYTAAGCYLCPSPRSKGTKILVICSVNSSLPMKMDSFFVGSSNGHKIKSHESWCNRSVGAKELLHGKIGNFKDRFLVPWQFIDENDGGCCSGLCQDSSDNLENCFLVKNSLCSDYVFGAVGVHRRKQWWLLLGLSQESVLEARHTADAISF